VKAVRDAQKGTFDVAWAENPLGRKPVAWKVYGSDERGFSASDVEYDVYTGRGLCDSMKEYNARTENDPGCGHVKTPANLVGRTAERRMTVAGAGLKGPNANRAYYRVVAVDEKGNDSTPSDYAEIPRPFIYTAAPDAAKVGQAYRYEPAAILSIGHMTCKTEYTAAYWGSEKLAWTIERGPGWLKLEKSALAGTPGPGDVGKTEVSLKVANNKGAEARQSFTIAVTD
jgi:hypothetical protein